MFQCKERRLQVLIYQGQQLYQLKNERNYKTKITPRLFSLKRKKIVKQAFNMMNSLNLEIFYPLNRQGSNPTNNISLVVVPYTIKFIFIFSQLCLVDNSGWIYKSCKCRILFSLKSGLVECRESHKSKKRKRPMEGL